MDLEQFLIVLRATKLLATSCYIQKMGHFYFKGKFLLRS